jgi:hypothetical protein
MLVALRGRVESRDPKTCELSDRKAVIYEVCKQAYGSHSANKSHAQYRQPAQKVCEGCCHCCRTAEVTYTSCYQARVVSEVKILLARECPGICHNLLRCVICCHHNTHQQCWMLFRGGSFRVLLLPCRVQGSSKQEPIAPYHVQPVAAHSMLLWTSPDQCTCLLPSLLSSLSPLVLGLVFRAYVCNVNFSCCSMLVSGA